MRRLLRFRVRQLPWVPDRTASSFVGNGNGGGGSSRRKNKDLVFDSAVSDIDMRDSAAGREGVRASCKGGTRKALSGSVEAHQVLFPDAQSHELDDMAIAAKDEAVEVMEDVRARAPTKMKKRYENFIRPKRGTVVLTSSFSGRSAVEVKNEDENEEEDVTRIYSRDEVDNKRGNARQRDTDPASSIKLFTRSAVVPDANNKNVRMMMTAAAAAGGGGGGGRRGGKERNKREIEEEEEDEVAEIYDSTDMVGGVSETGGHKRGHDIAEVLAHERPQRMGETSNGVGGKCDDAQVVRTECDHVNGASEDEFTLEEGDRSDEFINLRKHPFFVDLLRRVSKNAVHQRQQIKTAGRYNLDAVNMCLRPLLQFADYPFTIYQLGRMAPFIYPDLLKRSLCDLKSCRHLHIYRSVDTDVVLDWSVEDFLRRRYEGIHLSWEPVKIVMMRFGWNQDLMSDRDCLLYFSKFLEFIELAELELSAGDDKPKALPLEDPVRVAEQRPIPVSKLLIRRAVAENTEPSVTESIRLMGTPALRKPAKSRKARALEKDSVEGTFERIIHEAESVDGDEETKLQHGIDTVPSMRQASHPSGRSIGDFSLGIRKNAVITDDKPQTPSLKLEQKPFDETHCSHSQESYEALANAYHKKKVEASLARRRLLSTDNIDDAARMQEKLATLQKELPRLRDRLEKMRQQRQMEKETAPDQVCNNAGSASRDGGKTMGTNARVEAAVSSSATVDSQEEQKECPASKTSHASQFDMMEETMQQQQRKRMGKNRDAAGDNATDGELADESAKWNNKRTTASEKRGAVPPLEEIQSLSSAALLLRQEIQSLQKRHRHEEEVLLKRMEETLGTLLKMEATMKSVAQQEERDAEAKAEAELQRLEMQKRELEEEEEMKRKMEREREREKKEEEERERVRLRQAEARARALEEELLRKHEERVRVLNKQREEARQAQREAELALERQRQVEQAALEEEAELERRLQEAKSRIWSGEADVKLQENQKAADMEEKERTALLTSNDAKPSEKRTASSLVSAPSISSERTSEPTCTPEQYDGLHLAAQRLRKEIAELERQMENEGDEDDMTLMAVLAVSRADLEELEDFIRLVQRREPWSAERDKARKEEQELEAREGCEGRNDLQEKISNIRFQIELTEKRLQHATERSVITRLEQSIINGRREINRLRLEQDRLRRTGKHADAGGVHVPPSISVAEALAQEDGSEDGKNMQLLDARDGAEEIGDETEMMTSMHGNTRSAHVGGGNAEHVGAEGVKGNVASGECVDYRHGFGDADGSGGRGVELKHDDQQELKQLTGRLEGMLEEIRRLEEGIAENENKEDAEATAASLVELQKRLQQLLEVRDAIRRRAVHAPLGESTKSSDTAAATGETPSTRKLAVFVPLSSRPVSHHAPRAGVEVLHFQQRDSRHVTVPPRRREQKTAKTKKTRR